MADGTKIEWTEATWNPITGCAVVSPGCTNCYAMKLAGTRLRNHPSRAGLTRDSKSGPVWTGEVRFNEQWLMQPLQWTRPRMIFVCAHGDLFAAPFEWIDRTFAVMALAPQHTFQVLTKRSAEMHRYYSAVDVRQRVAEQIMTLRKPGTAMPTVYGGAITDEPDRVYPWPLPNVWLGVSAEDQRRADERIPDLLATPAAVRWVSAEPLLGPIDFLSIPGGGAFKMATSMLGAMTNTGWHNVGLSWVVVGGESGPGARPMHPDWARSIRDQCRAAGVAYFFKQWGRFRPQNDEPEPDGYWSSLGPVFADRPVHEGFFFGRSPTQRPWPMFDLGKKAAGRLLDGVEHNEMPAVRA